MIGPVRNLAELHELAGNVQGAIGAYPAPPPDLSAFTEMAGRDLGLRFQPEPAVGRYFAAPMPDGSTRLLERVTYYALAEPDVDSLRKGVVAMVQAVARDFGPGLVWTLAGRAHVIHEPRTVPADGVVHLRSATNDSSTECRFPPGYHVWRLDSVDGVNHARLRMWVCHENGPEGPPEGARWPELSR